MYEGIRVYRLGITTAVADPGFVKREGRESKCRARPEKFAQRGGGLRHIFFFFFFCVITLWGRATVRLPDRPMGWKAKKKKKGRGGGPRPIRPPWIRHCDRMHRGITLGLRNWRDYCTYHVPIRFVLTQITVDIPLPSLFNSWSGEWR